MKLECLRKRPGGTKVQLGSAEYHFRPDPKNPTGPHVCEVDNQGHLKTLLTIDAYVLADDDSVAADAPTQVEPAKTASAPAPAPKKGPEKPEAPVNAPEPTQAEKEPHEPAKDPGSEADEEGDDPLYGITAEMLEEMERDELADLYEKVSGKKPHHNTVAQKLIEGITPKLKA